ncbi:MAG: MFS transporter [Parachlamydiales bacterium]|nr:MFS transporter [Parachlamydiales bacterium]
MNASERAIIFPVTIGSMLEWYEVYLYIYWTPIIANNLWDLSIPIAELVNFLLFMFVGLIARPLGSLIFGYIGDKWGRKKSFLLSIILVAIPSILTAMMPTFAIWNAFSIIYITAMKFIQGIPSGGELPGAMCFLAETASPTRKTYLTSYALIGPQIGQILSMAQCLVMELYFSQEFLILYGWRISFFIGGLIGLLGYFLRKKLHESHSFTHIKSKNEIHHNPIKYALKRYKHRIVLGFLISIFEVVGFYLIAFYLVANANKILKINIEQNLLMNLAFLTPLTILLPIIGKIGDKINNKYLYYISAIGVIISSAPFYYSINNSLTTLSIIFLALIILFFSIQFALLPSLLTRMFPTPVRYTCLGLSFNVCDSVVGVLAPVIGFLISKYTGNNAAFIIIYPITALLFLLVFPKIKHHAQIY